ncbi:MAG: hypothetical protein EXR69_05130 [Myxococcales bacterium]|nr:hypothetical protein [Myxococcales bacterium]
MSTTPASASTREALADWREATSRDWLADDPHFSSLAPDFPELRPFAAACATAIDAWARNTNRDEHLPRLQRFDADGRRTEGIVFHPDHQRIGEAIWAVDLLGRYREPGHERETLSLLYLLAQNGEGGWCCPMACTAGMIKVCQSAERADRGESGLPSDWLGRLLTPDFAGMLYASQFLTEIQGGSDVGANAVTAKPADPGDPRAPEAGWWCITGEKWFCSVIDASLFLVTARPEGAKPGTAGLKAFVVPRTLPGLDPRSPTSEPNLFAVRRLKWKLGTRSMASAEVDFVGAYGWPVADFQGTVEIVLNTSRLYNAVCACAILQRAWREADAFARTRVAFGKPILDFPAVARTVARLKCEAYAARSLTFHLAALSDEIALANGQLTLAGPDTDRRTVWRMLVNLNKIWTALTCPAGVREAIEVLGGNGAIEEFSVLPRLLRDSLVLEAWEGGHGVLCAQVLKDARRGLHVPMFAHLRQIAISAGVRATGVDALAGLWEHTLARPDAGIVWRDLLERSRAPVQALMLRAQTVPEPIIDHFVALHDRERDPLTDNQLGPRIRAVVG